MDDQNIFTNELQGKFSIISNDIINCGTLTCGAKGLLCYLCSKPNNWQFYMADIQKHMKDNIKKYVKELSDLNILERTRVCLGQSKGFCWKWRINYDSFSSLEKQVHDNNDFTIVANHDDSENSQYSNTNLENNTDSKSNTDIVISKKAKVEKKSYGEFKRVKLTDEEYDKLNQLYGLRLKEALSMLDDYLEYKGRQYKSHYAVLKRNNWVYNKVFPMMNANYKKNSRFATRSEKNTNIIKELLNKYNEGDTNE